MSGIIEKLGITKGPYTKERIYFGEPEHRINVINPVGVKGTIAECYSKENALLFAAAPEMLEHLFKIIKAQHDPNATLANLNGTIGNARNFLIEKYPEIKELL